MSTGGYFGKSALDIGMELEDQKYERWKTWATREVVDFEQRRAAVYTGDVEGGDTAVDSVPAEYEAAIEEVSDQGQSALGGARVRP